MIGLLSNNFTKSKTRDGDEHLLILGDDIIGRFNTVDNSMKFMNEEMKTKFNIEVSNQGIKPFLKDKFGCEYNDISPDIIAASVVYKDMDIVKEIFNKDKVVSNKNTENIKLSDAWSRFGDYFKNLITPKNPQNTKTSNKFR